MKRNKIAISLNQITKTYTLHHEKPTFIENLFKRGQSEKFTAINKLSLDIKQGEKIGVVGVNGSGKTTLLKIISGITTANHGSVVTNGKVVSLIDLEAGFHPDLTGEENIYLNGLIIGMSSQDIKKNFKKIVRFADIGQFIDAPLYTYSMGMVLRLGFSVAVFSNPDILLLDEGIAVGDERFRAKANKKIEQFYRKGKTVIMVSHWLEYLKKNCDRIIWLDKGKIKKDGGVKVLADYAKKK